MIGIDPSKFSASELIEANNKAYILSQNGQFEKAKPYVDKAINLIAPLISANIYFTNFTAKDYAKIFAMGGFIYAELGKADTSINLYRHYQFLKTQLKHGFPGKDFITLYQFRGTKPYVFENLKKNQFTLADPREQNDIVDSPVFAWLDFVLGKNAKFEKHIPCLKASFDGYRIASFCQDTDKKRAVENTLMWAHYAESHQGFCIQYHIDSSDFRRDDKTKLFAARLFPVDYFDTNNWDLDMSDPQMSLTSKKAYFTKSIDWAYEKEVRMVSYDPLSPEQYPPFELKDKSYISAIYFGVKCKDDIKNAVREALQGKNIKYYQMKINPKNIYSLLSDEITI